MLSEFLVQCDHLKQRVFKAMWCYSSQCLCIATRGRSSHAHERGWHTEHFVMKGWGETVLIGRRKTAWSPRWQGWTTGKKGPCFCPKLDFQAFVFTSVNIWMNLQANIWTSHLTELVWPPGETMGLGCSMPCHWGPVQNKAIRPKATHRFCWELLSRVQTCITEP